jgi:hypothetical protein
MDLPENIEPNDPEGIQSVWVDVNIFSAAQRLTPSALRARRLYRAMLTEV